MNGTVFMHAGIRPEPPGDVDDVNRKAAARDRRMDDIRAVMVKAQLVPPFCTLGELVSAAAAEDRTHRRRASGENAARRARDAGIRRPAADS